MANKPIIIAIDGYSGTGKSSTARAVANRLEYRYVDSGAMYRAVTYHFMEHQVDLKNESAVSKALNDLKLNIVLGEDGNSNITLGGKHVGNKIRSHDVNTHVSKVAAIPMVRKDLVERQQKMGKEKKLVMDGRDIGTIVFPGAELKIFMTAGIEERTKRRHRELKQLGITSNHEEIRNNLHQRDLIDSSRTEGPLTKAGDAVELDTTHLTFDEQVENIVKLAKEIISEN